MQAITQAQNKIGRAINPRPYDLGSSGHFLSKIANYRQLEFLSLVSLHHVKNPENERSNAKHAVDQETHQRQHPSAKNRRRRNHPQQNISDNYAAKKNQGLRRVKPHERPLINQIEDQTGDPASHIAKQPL